MNSSPRFAPATFRASVALIGLAVTSGGVVAQDAVRLSAGDSVRVGGVIVGRVLNIDGPTMTVVSRAAPRCRAGEMHGEGPICDPAPLVRHTMNLDEVVIERRSRKSHLGLRTLGGGLVGASAFGAVGYLVGPSIGFGNIDGCVIGRSRLGCRADEPRYSEEELLSRQRSSDQWKGAFMFGMIGGTAAAILANKLSQGWVRVEPAVTVGGDDPWGVGVRLPMPR